MRLDWYTKDTKKFGCG